MEAMLGADIGLNLKGNFLRLECGFIGRVGRIHALICARQMAQ